MTAPTAVHAIDDDTIRLLVVRLARPLAGGGHVIARATILAEGADFAAVVRWITAHDGVPEATAAAPRSAGGLHGARGAGGAGGPDAPPRRYVFPPGALAPPSS